MDEKFQKIRIRKCEYNGSVMLTGCLITQWKFVMKVMKSSIVLCERGREKFYEDIEEIFEVKYICRSWESLREPMSRKIRKHMFKNLK